jgi:hypothetical protein
MYYSYWQQSPLNDLEQKKNKMFIWEIPNGKSEVINVRRTDNTMAIGNRTIGETMNYNTWLKIVCILGVRVRVIVFNATFSNISVISCIIGWDNHWLAASHCQTVSHNVIPSTPRLSVIRIPDVSGDRHWLQVSGCLNQ